MKNLLNLGVVLAAATAFGATAELAHADTISIGWSTDNGATINTVATGSGTANASFNAGGFAITSANGTGNPPLVLPTILQSGVTLNVTSVDSTRTTNTIWVYVTETDITQPLGPNVFSAFMANTSLQNATITMVGLLDSTDHPYTGTDIGSPFTFTSLGTSVQSGLFNITGQYSVTALYEVTAGAGGNANGVLNISAVPGPIVGAGLPGLIAACGGLLALARRRRHQRAA